MANNTLPTFAEVMAKTQELMAAQKFAEAAEFTHEVHTKVVEDYRANKDSDKPSIKKAAEVFSPSEELEEVAQTVLSEIRARIFAAISETPELSVLLYSGLKEYAQDHVKEYRDAVLRGVLSDLSEDEDESDYELPLTRDELDKVRTMVESFVNFAELSGQTPDIPRREKTGNIKFANTKGYGEDAVTTKDEVTRFTYFVDGEEIAATKLADVALWNISSANEVYTPSDVMRLVREQHGNKELSKGWKVEVNGRVLEARPNN